MAEPRRTVEHISFDRPVKLLFVQAPFYHDIIDSLSSGAFGVLDHHSNVTAEVMEVPGALEIPAAIGMAAGLYGGKSGGYDGYVALGCVVRGATYHFEIVCNESSRGIMDLTTRHGLAIGNGILTVENDEQAWERADIGRLNKGADAARAALALVHIKRRFGG